MEAPTPGSKHGRTDIYLLRFGFGVPGYVTQHGEVIAE